MEQKTGSIQIGKASIQFEKGVHILASGTVVGKKEGEGPLGKKFDLVCQNPEFGEENWEQAESTMQSEALQTALGKAGKQPWEIRYLFGGDLLGQLIATSFGIADV